MSLSNITEKTNLYLKNAYSALQDKGALLPNIKNLANLADCTYTVHSESVIIPPEAGNVTSIVINKLPLKLDYREGEEFDFNGIVVNAVYSSGYRRDITKACIFEVNSPLTTNDKTVIVKYGEFSTSLEIKVYAEIEPIPEGTLFLYRFNDNIINEISGIAEGNTYRMAYREGKFQKGIYGTSTSTHFQIQSDKLPTIADITGGAANCTYAFWMDWSKMTYSTSTSKTTFCSISSYGVAHRLHYGGNFISMYGFDTNREDGIEKFYYFNEDFIKQGWHHFALVYKEGKKSLFIDGKKVMSGWCSSQSGTNGIYLSADNSKGTFDELIISTEALYTDDFEIPKNKYGGISVLERLFIEQMPNKLVYKSGELFSLEGAIVKATYSDGYIRDVTKECLIENAETPLTLEDIYKMLYYTDGDIIKRIPINIGVYKVESELDLSATKLLMNFDGNTADLTGLNTLTLNGNNLYGEGKSGMARYFNGTTDYISMPYTQDLNIDTGDFTIACWFKLLTVSGIHVIWSIMNSDTYGSRVYVSENKLHVAACTNTDDTIISGLSAIESPLSINTWYHIALVRKGNTFTSYLNGKLINTVENSSVLVNGSNLLIGRFTDSQPFLFNGYIDDFILAKSALWDTEFDPPSESLSY